MTITSNTSLQPYIEYIEYVNAHNDYASKKHYLVDNKDSAYHIKWCRRNLGNRGDGWDFAGSGKSLTIIIWSHKLQCMYEMWMQ